MSLLGKLKEWGEKQAREAAPVNPVVFNDPIAMNTQWIPLVPGGSNFGTHRLVELDATRLAMKKSVGLYLFGTLFLTVGMTVIVVGAFNGAWLASLFGLPFAAAGAFVILPQSILFDGSSRQFSTRKRQVAFSAIHAVQVVKEHVSGEDSNFWSYELNLVLKDGERINVVDHGDLPRIRTDSQRICALIGCKFWDATTVL